MPDIPHHDTVRRSYDTVAGDYANHLRDELAHKPLDRALLAALLEQTGPDVPIADLGCGPGHVSGWIADQGGVPVGIDLSAGMIERARTEHPQVEFRVGDLLGLPAVDGEFGAVLALYSIIHLEPDDVVVAFAEIHRVLRPGGRALISFHVGTEVRHFAEWWGHAVDIDFRFLEPQRVTELLERAGFVVEARLERTNHPEEVETRRAYLLARRGD
jgi:SAM-dependent methyltransferase